MANEVTTPTATALAPDMAARLYKGIAESRATTVITGGKPLLRMLKDGVWVYGQRDDPVQEGSSWAVNPLSIMHGWSCWTNHQGTAKNTLVGEQMVPVYEAKPAKPVPVDNWPFSEQRAFELKCLDGEDAGTEVLYKSGSVGGMRAVDELLQALQAQLNANPAFPCPVLQLNNDSYQHAKYGKTYVPIFEIVDWANMNGELAAAVASPPAVAPPAPDAPEPTARRRPGRPAVVRK